MIVQCPNCQSKSRVDDAGAARGARARCANCRHVFLPLAAVVAPEKTATPGEEPSGFGADESFGGKTSLFTGVVTRESVGLSSLSAQRSQAPDSGAAAPMVLPPEATVPDAALVPAAAAAPQDSDFKDNRTQAIDVRQLAAFSAKLSAPEPNAAWRSDSPLPNGLGLADRTAPPAKASWSRAVGGAVGVDVAAAPLADRGDTGITTGSSGRIGGGPMSGASRFVLAMTTLLMVCGIIFCTAGRAVYASLGWLGGQSIVLAGVRRDAVRVEEVKSVVYTLADGHDALVVLGSVRNEGAVAAAKVELAFTLADAQGVERVRQRAPLGAILSLEELATLTRNDSAEAELRRRVQHVPALAAHGHGQKFMVVVRDPPRPLRAFTQRLAVVPALPLVPAAQPKASTAAEASDVTGAFVSKALPAAAAAGSAAADTADTQEVQSNMPAIVQPALTGRATDLKGTAAPRQRHRSSHSPLHHRRP